jgi:acetyltransferase-like isoleucine patch superfamily enzyme
MKAGLFARLLFRWRIKTWVTLVGRVGTSLLRLQGAVIGRRTIVPRHTITWPHQLRVGADCSIEGDVYFKFDGIWCPGPSIVIGDGVFVGRGCEFNIRKCITIGNGCAIASGCKFIDHDHNITEKQMNEASLTEAAIVIGDHVWLGCNVIVLKGVTIGSSAVIGAGAVVTKDVPAGAIWAGIPAKKISERPS